MKIPEDSYSPLESLEEEVERFFKTNSFNPLFVTNFYAQARIVISDYKSQAARIEELERTSHENP